ncbi:helix-turn-helix domain-containing protein [Rhodopila sp.]|uniref:helix-turn-helix domain-containing protein n=1 Tax=Rhodopila sp. TaxID=2480087 RepID=UPI003D099BA8
MTPEQCRAARGWLSWSQGDLAKASGVSLSTVRDFEKSRRAPIRNNLEAMERALTGAGIKFLPSGVEGKQTRPIKLTESADA